MRSSSLVTLALSLPLAVELVSAHSHHHDHLPRHVELARRARATTTTTAAAKTKTRQAAAQATSSTVPAVPLRTTYPAGAQPTLVKGAPPLPDPASINMNDYPDLDLLPPLNSTEMQEWISQVDMANIPNIPPTGVDGCSNTTYNAQAIAASGADGNCWWTCGHCTRDTDITFCPAKGTWGASFDDGPSPWTPSILNWLEDNDLKATFFTVGSRAVSRPEILQAAYMAGHQISAHTWAHSSLTTLTNEGIIAELAWSKAIIKAITGVTPNTMRPPYGDIDDRVRYISLQLGLTPIIWTVEGTLSCDTQDWQISDPSTNVTPQTVLNNFQNIFNNASEWDTGFIVLAHDLDPNEVSMEVDHILPEALSRNLTLQPIITCLGQDLSQAYAETYVSRDTAKAQNGSVVTSVSVSTEANGSKVTTTVTSTSSSSSTSKPTSSGARSSVASGVAGLLALAVLVLMR